MEDDARGGQAPAYRIAGPIARAPLLHDASALAAYLEDRLRRVPDTDLVALPSGASRVAAVLALLYPRDGVLHLLFTRRASSLTVHSGEISFPGGSREREDASLVATALRETYEELALEPELVGVLGPLPPVVATVSDFVVAPYLGWLPEGLPSLQPNVQEVAEVIEAPVAALADPDIFHAEQWTRGGQAHTVYFYDLGPHRIWGLTGRILHTLLELMPAE
jgi:8-oxo-dGTP pyrophosphatase MutT (NUDIX family)